MARFRVNVFIQRGSCAVVMRVIPTVIPTFSSLHLPPQLEEAARVRNGIILVTGGTGSGKSSTLAALIDRINSEYCYHVLTVEDPIEFLHRHKKSTVHQRELHSDAPNFTMALRAALRQAPRVIMVGEMRDLETMTAAISAAESGHLVLSTVHTIDAVHAINRIVDAYPPHEQGAVRQQVAGVISGVVAQRLVRSADGNVRYPATEILLGTTFMKRLLSEGRTEEIARLMAQDTYYGMHTFDQDLEHLHAQNLISTQEALNHATNLEDLALKLRGVDRGITTNGAEGIPPKSGTPTGPEVKLELPREQRPPAPTKKTP